MWLVSLPPARHRPLEAPLPESTEATMPPQQSCSVERDPGGRASSKAPEQPGDGGRNGRTGEGAGREVAVRVAFGGIPQAHGALCLLEWGQAPDVHSHGPLQNHRQARRPGPRPSSGSNLL